jgi:biopolymer transport protein ExbD
MRRFSQRNSLVTLADINITPLLDLAFVLLIIFVITTPLLEQGLNLKLPVGDVPENRKIDPKDVKTIEISPNGSFMMSGQAMGIDQIGASLAVERRRNPKVIVYVRADENAITKHLAAVLNKVELAGIDQVSVRTTPRSR